MNTRHLRFAIHDVTFGGAAMPGATIDQWHDVGGNAQWSARLVTRPGAMVDEGELSGRTKDGRFVSGHALVSDRQVGPGGGPGCEKLMNAGVTRVIAVGRRIERDDLPPLNLIGKVARGERPCQREVDRLDPCLHCGHHANDPPHSAQ